MEIRQLKYFISAAKHLNFTNAAQECFIVQSAMSQQIAALENELSVQLFERKGRFLKLTTEGQAFLVEADKILRQLDASVTLVQNIPSGYGRIMRIGCHANLLREELPEMLYSFRKEAPDVKVILTHNIAQKLLVSLDNREIDFMISAFSPEFKLMEWLDYRIIKEEKVKLMVSSRHKLAKHTSVSRAQLRGEPFILLRGNDQKNHLIDWADQGNLINAYCYVDDENSVETLVAAGYGVSLCLESACRNHRGIVYLDMPEEAREPLCISWNKKHKLDLVEQYLLSLFLMNPSE